MQMNIKDVRKAGAALGLAALSAITLAAGVAGAEPTKSRATRTPCFFITQWQGWKSPTPDVLYLGVNLHDVYKVELSGEVSELQWPDVHLISEVRGSDSICTALDLQLYVADEYGHFKVGLIPKTLTKLTPEEVAAIPKKYRPN